MEHRLPHSREAAAVARELAADTVRGRLDPRREADFVLMVDELVTNAVVHAIPLVDGTIGLRIEAVPATIRAVVVDGSPDFTPDLVTRDPRDGRLHLGLFLVDRLSDRWGLSLDGKKAVWFEVDA